MNDIENEQIENKKIITKYENICADLNLNSEKNDWAKTYFFLKLIIKNINLYFNNPENILNNLNINGSWGTGKSTIAYQVINNYEKNENNICSKFFNLWNYEIYDNPFLKILIDICNFLEIKKDEIWETISWTLGLNISILGYGGGVKFKKDKQISEFSKKAKELKELDNLIVMINNELNQQKNKYLIIFDEIDRCLPENQIKYLSLINNLIFKLNNIFFITCSNNNAINAIILNYYSKKYHYLDEQYTDKIFIKSLDLNDFSEINQENLPILFKENLLILDFIKELNLKDLRIIKNLYYSINSFLKENKLDIFFNNKNLKRLDIDDEKTKEFLILYFLYFKKYHKNVFKQLINSVNLFKKFYDTPKKYDKKFIYYFDNQYDIDKNNYLKNNSQSTFSRSLLNEIEIQRIDNIIYERSYGFEKWPLVVKIKKIDKQEIIISPELFYFLLDDTTKVEINKFKFIKTELPYIRDEENKGRQYIYVLKIEEKDIIFSNEIQISTLFKVLLKSDKYNFFFDFDNLNKIINQLILY